jgi:hypothetical protein
MELFDESNSKWINFHLTLWIAVVARGCRWWNALATAVITMAESIVFRSFGVT